MSIYRLRTCENLLGKFEELEKQSIFLADSASFNDPVEDFVYLEYKGDKILWENMFKEFLVAMEYKMFTAPLYSHDMLIDFKSETIFGPKTHPYFGHKDYNIRMAKITEKFFSYEPVNEWCEYLSKRAKPINNEQLIGIFNIISYFATESILHVFDEHPLVKDFYPGFMNILQKNICEIEKNSKNILSKTNNSDKDDELLHWLNLDFQAITMIAYSSSDLANYGISNFYFWFDFPIKFVDELKDFIYYRWYAAAFMRKPPMRMDLWANYAKEHSGVCLIFKDRLGFSGIPRSACLKMENVEYNNEIITVDFFKRMWVLNRNDFYNDWCKDRLGNVSPIFEQATKYTDEEHREFWEAISKIKYRKNKDWEAENEIRLTVDNNWINLTEPCKRLLKYDFNSLEGIVFGIRTSVLDKSRIFKIISSKCKEYERDNFKFYQAIYYKLNGVLIYDEIRNLGKLAGKV